MAQLFGTPGTVKVVKPSNTKATQFYIAQQWAWITFLKHSSGTIVIGTDSELQPTNIGGGLVLPNGQPISWLVSPGTTLYVIASSTAETFSVYSVLLDVIPLIVDSLLQRSGSKSATGPLNTGYPGAANWKR